MKFFVDKMLKKVMDFMDYEYDYFFIMYYGIKFFSLNGRVIIKICKKGKNIGVQIGQCKSLFWIDVVQVYVMYNCNKIFLEELSKLIGISQSLFYEVCWFYGYCV